MYFSRFALARTCSESLQTAKRQCSNTKLYGPLTCYRFSFPIPPIHLHQSHTRSITLPPLVILRQPQLLIRIVDPTPLLRRLPGRARHARMLRPHRRRRLVLVVRDDGDLALLVTVDVVAAAGVGGVLVAALRARTRLGRFAAVEEVEAYAADEDAGAEDAV